MARVESDACGQPSANHPSSGATPDKVSLVCILYIIYIIFVHQAPELWIGTVHTITNCTHRRVCPVGGGCVAVGSPECLWHAEIGLFFSLIFVSVKGSAECGLKSRQMARWESLGCVYIMT